MIDYSLFENLLKERLNKLYNSIEGKNSDIKHIQDTHLKDEGDIVGASMRGHLEMGMIDMYRKEMSEIQAALEKIKNGTFGICEMCDDDIDVARLKAKPHAKYCINCRELYEQSKKRSQA